MSKYFKTKVETVKTMVFNIRDNEVVKRRMSVQETLMSCSAFEEIICLVFEAKNVIHLQIQKEKSCLPVRYKSE